MNIFQSPNIYHFSEIIALSVLILFILLRRKSEGKPAPKIYLAWFIKLRRRPWLAYLLIGLLAFLTSALLSVFAGIPQPTVHDEFSYLLASDTFAHGRLANPTHPLWKHFETFHVIHHPTYASKYPPAQGLTLAIGQVIFGHPIVGVWLSVGLACAGICWMLAGWCPLRWALLGSLVAMVRIIFTGGKGLLPGMGLFCYWSQSYWGGAVAALGGALIFGALPRIMKNQSWRDSLWFGLGLAILANSRPFEGLVASLPAAIVLGIWLLRTKNVRWQTRFRQVALPIVSILLITFLWMGYYNLQVTGNPLQMPYQVNEDTYALVPPFLWQPLKTAPHYHHQVFIDFHNGYVNKYNNQRSFLGWIKNFGKVLITCWMFFFGILLTPALVFVATDVKSWRRWIIWFPTMTCTLVLLALSMETWFFPHYAAPVASLAFLLLVESLRRAHRYTWNNKPVGKNYVQMILPVLLAFSTASLAGAIYLKKSDLWFMDRARMLQELYQDKERHLVIIRYGPDHSPHHEWVYNKADIDGTKVVWAREIGNEADKELLEYFRERRVWLVNVDKLPRRLVPYPERMPGN